MNNATTPAAQANARDTATPTQPGFRSANFRATKYGTPTPTNIASNVGAMEDPLIVGGTPWEMVERFGTIRRDAIQRQRRVNITHRVVCCESSSALLARGEGRTRTGMGWRIAFHSWRALERQKSPNRNCDSFAPPELLFLVRDVTWVIMRPSAVRSVTARCRLSIQAIVRSFTVSLSGCTPTEGVAQNAQNAEIPLGS